MLMMLMVRSLIQSVLLRRNGNAIYSCSHLAAAPDSIGDSVLF